MEGEHKGKVIEYRHYLILDNAVFKVSEKGRQRVLKTKQKNVHAGVVGDLNEKESITLSDGVWVTYCPYQYMTFVDEEFNPIHTAERVYFTTKGLKAILEEQQ